MQEVYENVIDKLDKEKLSYFLTIANTGNEHLDSVYEKVGEAIDKAIEIVKQAAAKYNNGWISVSERLPEESLNSVIGWDAYRERCVFVQYLQGQWKLGDWESVKITHWMNMPEKPKGE